MKLTNQEIYNYAVALNNTFSDASQKLPVKVNFYLQKNKTALTTLAQDIDAARLEIIRNYGELNEESSSYVIPKEKVAEAQKELTDLFTLTQDVNIYTINIDSLSDDITLTTGQMEAIMFMID